MESSIKDVAVKCDIHHNENIRRVCLDSFCEKSIFCIECILASKEDVSQTHEQLVSLEEFIEKAAKFYEGNLKRAANKKETPSNLTEVFSLEGEQLENLSKHIEHQKSRVNHITNDLIARFTSMCYAKRDELHGLLNKELSTFKYNYQYYDKLLKKNFAFGDGENFFPSKKELVEKALKFQTGSSLFSFVKDIKTDMLDVQKAAEIKDASNEEERTLKRLEMLVKALTSEVPKALPVVIDPELPININYNAIMEDKVEKILEGIFVYENSVPDLSVTDISSLPNSRIIKKPAETGLLRKWLGKPATFKLLYSGHKDGYTPQAFHKKCDGKSNTLTVISSNSNKIFGGFIDKPWNSSEAYLVTEKAWLYSISCQKKYELKASNSQYAGYGSASYGPTFGGGNDFYLSGDFRTTNASSNPYSYNWTGYDQLAGTQSFTVKEIEVYSVHFGGTSVLASISSDNSEKGSNLFEKQESQILSKKNLQALTEILPKAKTVKKLYSAKKDGFGAEKFHKMVDGESNLLFIIKSTSKKVFGGYTTASMCDYNNWIDDANSFLFKMDGNSFRQFYCNTPNVALYMSDGTIVQFGEGPDLLLSNNADTSGDSSSYLADSFGDGTISSLADDSTFSVEDFEVFGLTSVDD